MLSPNLCVWVWSKAIVSIYSAKKVFKLGPKEEVPVSLKYYASKALNIYNMF